MTQDDVFNVAVAFFCATVAALAAANGDWGWVVWFLFLAAVNLLLFAMNSNDQ